MINNIVDILKKLNLKCLKCDEVPVSCVIVYNNKIIVKSYNKIHHFYDPFGHAEILAIKKACKILKTSNLSECELYVTLKPCNMCLEAIKNAKISKVFYIIDNKKIVNKQVNLIQFSAENISYFSSEISSFFKKKR